MNEFKVRKGLIVQGSGSNIFDVQGSQGQLFSVTDSLSGSLFSVNDISGIPIMEVFSDNTIKMGTFNQEAIIISGSRTGMGIAIPQAKLHISGANNNSLFRIQSPASASIMFVTGSGLVGIGTLTPTQKISVDNGNVGFTSGFGISWDSDTEWIRRAAAADQLQFATGNTVRLNIGNTQGQLVTIGLGATTGTAQFQVRGGGATAASTAMRIEDSGGNARLTILDDGTSAFNTSHLYISSSGNVGIGTTNPQVDLEVASKDATGTVARVRLTNKDLSVIDEQDLSEIQFFNSDADGAHVSAYIKNIAAETFGRKGQLAFGVSTTNSTNAVEAFRVDENANIGIGTTTPTNTLQVVGGITATSITSSLLGTASVAVNAQTASFLPIGTYNITSSWAQSASNARNAQTASFLPIGTYSITSSWAQSASNAVNAQTASFLSGAFLQGGNSFGATALLGTNDNQNLQLETSGSVRMTISSSGDVGIGTTSPQRRLHVDASGSSNTDVPLLLTSVDTNNRVGIRIASSSVSAGRQHTLYHRTNSPLVEWVLSSNSGEFATWRFLPQDDSSTGLSFLVPRTTPGAIRIVAGVNQSMLSLGASGSNQHLNISSSGNVGIGTTSPSRLLDVDGIQGWSEGTNVEKAYLNPTSTGVDFSLFGDNGTIRFDSRAGSNSYINTGNVGIGTTSPTSRLQIKGSGATSATTALRVENSAAAARLTILDDGTSAFNTSHLYISSSGNIGIGTSSPAYKLDVLTTDTSIESTIGFRNRVTSTPSATKSNATYGAQFETTIAGANSNGNALAFQAQIRVTGTNTNNAARGFLGRVTTVGAGNAATAAGGQFFLEHESSGVITNAYGLQVLNLTNLGSITNTYGVYVGDITVGTQTNTPFSFYAADSNAHNYFAGNVGIGTTSPTARLGVSGSTIITGSFNVNAGTTTPHIRGAALRVSELANGAVGTLTLGSVSNIYSDLGAFSFRGGITGTTEFMFLSGSRVGIGTNNPTNTLQVVGGITATSITSSLLGTASVAINAQTASFLPIGTYSITSSQAINAQTASFLPIGTYSITSSWAQSASNTVNAQTASFLPVGTYSITSSVAINALTASNITPSITNNTDNRVLTATGGGTINGESNLTFDGSVLTVTGRANISTSITSSTATVGFGLTSALNAGQTTIRGSGVDTVGALTIQNSGGTAVFTVLNGGTTGVGENNPSARLHVKGSGATSATTALRVENSSAAARLTILDDGTSAFNTNHLYVSSSGRVAVGTTTPQRLFDVYNGATSGIAASFGAQISPSNFSGISFGYVEQASALYRKSALVFERTDGHGGGTNASGKIHFLLNNNTSTSATALTDAVLTIDSVGTTAGTSRVGIGTRFPTASLHISGTVATDNLMRVQSRTGAEYFFISASGNVGIGTNLPSAELHISGASIDSLLQVGSPTQANTLFITGSNRVGIGTGTPRALFEVNDKIIAEAAGNVGIQTVPTDWIHLSSDPGNSKYLNIDAAQNGNPPPQYWNGSVARLWGNIQDDFALGTPDYWMEIKLGGNIVLIPCYLPEP